MLLSLPISNQLIILPSLLNKNIQLTVKRLDQVHADISGNKWFKLKYNIKEAKNQGYKQLLTFGGAYSNHIYATAAAAKLSGLQSIGVIRGEENLPLNDTLAASQAYGMKFYYLSRSEYKEKKSLMVLEQLKAKFGEFYLIPEGGTNSLAINGTMEILDQRDYEADIICSSIGTGGTLAGLLATAKATQQVWGFSALKGDFIHQEIENLLLENQISPLCKYKVTSDFHFGGYAKYTQELVDFIQDFKSITDIALDPIYTGKMMYGILDLIQKGDIPEGSKILAIHTGGLQGIRGFNKRNNTQLSIS